jgi:C-terminal processing protease CtpA/Prc
VNRPKKRDFFSGDVYVLVGGPTFSAASLFARNLKGQSNVTLVGEETGGGYYSNNGLLIPTLTLPNTGIRVRLPLFRLVPDRNAPMDGRGVMPDVLVRPTVDAVRKGVDRKMEAVKSLIRERERTMDQTIRKESASLQKG